LRQIFEESAPVISPTSSQNQPEIFPQCWGGDGLREKGEDGVSPEGIPLIEEPSLQAARPI